MNAEQSIRALRQLPYSAYLRTPYWRAFRRAVINERGRRCERCGAGGRLDVHHHTYARLGCERRSDVAVWCRKCHNKHHQRTFLDSAVWWITGRLTWAYTVIRHRLVKAVGLYHLSIILDALTCYLDYMKRERINVQNRELYSAVEETFVRVQKLYERLKKAGKSATVDVVKKGE